MAATASGRAASRGRLFALAAPHIRHRACEFFTAGATFPMPVPSHGAPYDPILRPTVLIMQQVIDYSMKTMVIACKKSSIEVGSPASGQICPLSAQPDWRALAPHMPQDNGRECRREARGHRVGLGGRLHELQCVGLGPLNLPVKSNPPGSNLQGARLIACGGMDAHARPLARSHALAHRDLWWTLSSILFQRDIPQARAPTILWLPMAARGLNAGPFACGRTLAVRCGRARRARSSMRLYCV